MKCECRWVHQWSKHPQTISEPWVKMWHQLCPLSGEGREQVLTQIDPQVSQRRLDSRCHSVAPVLSQLQLMWGCALSFALIAGSDQISGSNPKQWVSMAVEKSPKNTKICWFFNKERVNESINFKKEPKLHPPQNYLSTDERYLTQKVLIHFDGKRRLNISSQTQFSLIFFFFSREWQFCNFYNLWQKFAQFMAACRLASSQWS